MKNITQKLSLIVFVTIFILLSSSNFFTEAIDSSNKLAVWSKPNNWDFLSVEGGHYERKIFLICDNSKTKDKCEVIGVKISDEVNKYFSKNKIFLKSVGQFRTKNAFNGNIVCGKDILVLDYDGTSNNVDISKVILEIQKAIIVVGKALKINLSASSGAISGIGPVHNGTPLGFDWAYQVINAPNSATPAANTRVAVLDTGVGAGAFSNMNFVDPFKVTDDVTDSYTNTYLGTSTIGHGTLVASIVKETGQTIKIDSAGNSKMWNSGITQNTQIIPIKVCADAKCGLGSVVSGICAAAQPFPINSASPTGALAQVINLSFGSYITSPILEGALKDAISSGVTVVSSAGNSRGGGLIPPTLNTARVSVLVQKNLKANGLISDKLKVLPKAFCNLDYLLQIWGIDPKKWKSMDEKAKSKFSKDFLTNDKIDIQKQGRFNCPLYPAALSFGGTKPDGLISVGSVSQVAGGALEYSKFATQNEQVDIVAPGDQVLALQSNGKSTTVFDLDTSISIKSPAVGTSFSAAYVSGAAAAVIATRDDMNLTTLSPIQIEKILLDSAKSGTCIPGPDDPATVCGRGLLDVGGGIGIAKTFVP